MLMYTAALIKAYVPQCAQEEADRRLMLDLIAQYGDALLSRDCLAAHFTASSMILSPDGSRVLMAYHNLYDSWAWTGGHADGQDDPLSVAVREAREETGAAALALLTPQIVALDVLPVWGHVKRGAYVPTHLHLNLTYALCADDAAPVRVKPDENSGVRWLAADAMEQYVSEKNMLPIYQKILRQIHALTARTFFE